MSLERQPQRGEDLARKTIESGSHLFSFEDPRVQVFLAKLAYPKNPDAMTLWAEGDTEHPALSGPYRAYIDSKKEANTDAKIDITDHEAMEALLVAVRNQSPETLH